MINLRGIPTRICPACDGSLFAVVCAFDDEYNVAYYRLEAECYGCGAEVTVPTPLDLPELKED